MITVSNDHRLQCLPYPFCFFGYITGLPISHRFRTHQVYPFNFIKVRAMTTPIPHSKRSRQQWLLTLPPLLSLLKNSTISTSHPISTSIFTTGVTSTLRTTAAATFLISRIPLLIEIPLMICGDLNLSIVMVA